MYGANANGERSYRPEGNVTGAGDAPRKSTNRLASPPPWWIWASLAISSLAPIPWFQNEEIVIWLQSQGAGESSTRPLLDTLRWISIGLSALGLFVLPRVLTWVAALVYRIERVQIVLRPVRKYVIDPVWGVVGPPLEATAALVYATVSEVRRGVFAIATGASAAWFAFAILLANAWRGALVAVSWLGRAIGEIWQVIYDGLAYIGRVIGAAALAVPVALAFLLDKASLAGHSALAVIMVLMQPLIAGAAALLALSAAGITAIAVGIGMALAYAARLISDAFVGLSAVLSWSWKTLVRLVAVPVAVGVMVLMLPFVLAGAGLIWTYRQVHLGVAAIANALRAVAVYAGVQVVWLLDAGVAGVAIFAGVIGAGIALLAGAIGSAFSEAWAVVTAIARLLGNGMSALASAGGKILRDARFAVLAVALMLWTGLKAIGMALALTIALGLVLIFVGLGYPLRLVIRIAGMLGRASADAWAGTAAILAKTARVLGSLLSDAWAGITTVVVGVTAAIIGIFIVGLGVIIVALGYPVGWMVAAIGLVTRALADALAGAMTGLRFVRAVIRLVFSEAQAGVAAIARSIRAAILVFVNAMGLGLDAILTGLGYPWRALGSITVAAGRAVADAWAMVVSASRLVAIVFSVAGIFALRAVTDALAVVAMIALWLRGVFAGIGLAIGARFSEAWLGVVGVAAILGGALGAVFSSIGHFGSRRVDDASVGVTAITRTLWAGGTLAGQFGSRRVVDASIGVSGLSRSIWAGGTFVAQPLGAGFTMAGARAAGRARVVANDASQTMMFAGRARPYLLVVIGGVGAAIGLGVATIGMTLARIPGWILWNGSLKPLVLTLRMGLTTVFRLGSPQRDFSLTPARLTAVAFTLALLAAIPAAGVWALWPGPGEPVITVVHWSTGHLTREGLLPAMAEKFNDANYRMNGMKIVVQVYDAPSELQSKYLIPRVKFGTKLDLNEITNGYVEENIPDPTILTPSSAHWLVTANYELGREVADIDGALSIVKPVIGIVTYEEMARCLGWPEKELGFADIIALRDDPEGWASYPCARAEWGKKPLLAFTDPITSSTGRSLHLSLYSIAAGKAPEDLTIEDVNDPDVIKYVKNFQTLIDHYTIGTTVLNTKIYQGTGFGHFFIMPEDNLIHLYEGTERSFLNGIKTTAPPITESMVMIYPKEGAMPRNNCACIVNADWVSLDQAEAAKVWIDYIRQDEQQRAFMAAGFRPGTDISLRDPASKITTEFGLNPNPPRVVLNPSLTKPEVAAAIDAAWVDIKRPGIVTFVVDTSGSMLGGNIQQAREGMFGALDATASNNQVGFVTFDDAVNDRVPVALLTADHKRKIEGLVEDMRAGGETALYDAIRAGIEMTDAAEGEADAIRAVVVLTDGQANRCQTRLDDLIRTTSRNEVDITSFGGCKSQSIDGPREASGRLVSKQEVIGHSLAIETKHPIQIFFIGIGDDADLDIGRMLAEATGAEFQGAAEEDLAEVLEEFSRYF